MMMLRSRTLQVPLRVLDGRQRHRRGERVAVVRLRLRGSRLRLDRPAAAVGGGELPHLEHQHLAAVVAHERGLALGLVLQQH